MRKWDKKEFGRKLRRLQSLIAECKEKDMNEAQTRQRLAKILTELLGYDEFRDITSELLVRGTGTDHLDFAMKLKGQLKFIIELKAVGISLGEKHLRQVLAYGMNVGTEWCLLTNSVDWQLYHITFTKPIKPDLVLQFNFLENDSSELYEKMYYLSKLYVSRNGLDKLWKKTEGLSTLNIFKALFTSSTLNSIRKNIRQETGVSIPPEEIVSAFRKMLNEKAASVLDDMMISFSERKPKRKIVKKKEESAVPMLTENIPKVENTSKEEETKKEYL